MTVRPGHYFHLMYSQPLQLWLQRANSTPVALYIYVFQFPAMLVRADTTRRVVPLGDIHISRHIPLRAPFHSSVTIFHLSQSCRVSSLVSLQPSLLT